MSFMRAKYGHGKYRNPKYTDYQLDTMFRYFEKLKDIRDLSAEITGKDDLNHNMDPDILSFLRTFKSYLDILQHNLCGFYENELTDPSLKQHGKLN